MTTNAESKLLNATAARVEGMQIALVVTIGYLVKSGVMSGPQFAANLKANADKLPTLDVTDNPYLAMAQMARDETVAELVAVALRT